MTQNNDACRVKNMYDLVRQSKEFRDVRKQHSDKIGRSEKGDNEMTKEETLADLETAIENWNIKLVQDATNRAIEEEIPIKEIVESGLGKGIKNIGERFNNAEIFLPQVVAASKTMEVALKQLEPVMKSGDDAYCGTVIMGTVEGDIHEIGKNVCCAMLRGAGFNVIDLGPDVSAQDFIDSAEENDAKVIGASALMTTTLEGQREIVESIKEAEAPYKAIFGGAPCSKEWCDKIGADGYSKTAGEIVDLVKSLM
jgi:trimethylamine corrinoid protein